MNKRLEFGFFMTEFLIYLALSACMSIFIMRYIYGTVVRLRASTQHIDRIVSMHAALDAICNDLQEAPEAATEWRTLNDHALMWQQGNSIIGWKVDHGILKRTIQHFDTKEQRWKRAISHVALEDVVAIEFAPRYEDRDLQLIMVAITGRMTTKKTYQCKRSVTLRHRVTV